MFGQATQTQQHANPNLSFQLWSTDDISAQLINLPAAAFPSTF